MKVSVAPPVSEVEDFVVRRSSSNEDLRGWTIFDREIRCSFI